MLVCMYPTNVMVILWDCSLVEGLKTVLIGHELSRPQNHVPLWLVKFNLGYYFMVLRPLFFNVPFYYTHESHKVLGR